MVERNVVLVTRYPGPVECKESVYPESVEVPGHDVAHQLLPPPVCGVVPQFGVSHQDHVGRVDAELLTRPVEF